MNIITYVDFICERYPLLVDFSIDDCCQVEINSVRLIRQVANPGQLYSRPAGFSKAGPAYEAAWIYGQPGTNYLLSPAQLVTLQAQIAREVKFPHLTIPEDQLIYVEVLQ